MPIDGKIIASRIREERKRKGLTQIELAERLYVSEKSVKNWEKNGLFNIYDLYAMHEFFGCSLEYLLGDEDFRLHADTDISFETGLSERSIEKIRKYVNPNAPDSPEAFLDWLNGFIESSEFDEIVDIYFNLYGLDCIDVDFSNKELIDELLEGYTSSNHDYYPVGYFAIIANSDLAKDIEVQKAADIFKNFLRHCFDVELCSKSSSK